MTWESQLGLKAFFTPLNTKIFHRNLHHLQKDVDSYHIKKFLIASREDFFTAYVTRPYVFMTWGSQLDLKVFTP